MTDNLQSNVLTVDPDGTIGAVFTGKLDAQGVVFPGFTSTPSADTSQIQWQRASDNAVLADIEAGEDVPVTGQQTQLFLVAESPDVAGNPIAGIEIAANVAGAGQSVQAFANGIEKSVLKGDGASSFLQLLSAQKLQLALGHSTLTWPGASGVSNTLTINHGLGGSPQGGGALGGDGNAALVIGYSGFTATQVTFRGFYSNGFQPANGDQHDFLWLLVG